MFIAPNGLYFHYENVSRQDLLPKPNHANITVVPRSCEIVVVPKAPPNSPSCKDPNPPSDMWDKHRYKLPRNSSFARARNQCIFTGRSRSVYKLFRIPRIVSRGLASRGSLMGIKKSSR